MKTFSAEVRVSGSYGIGRGQFIGDNWTMRFLLDDYIAALLEAAPYSTRKPQCPGHLSQASLSVAQLLCLRTQDASGLNICDQEVVYEMHLTPILVFFKRVYYIAALVT